MRAAGTYRYRSSTRPMVRGLGQLPSFQQSGFFTVDCSSPLTWAFNPACWDNSPAAWAQMNAIATAAGPMPQPIPPGGPTTIQQETLPGAFTPDQAIATGVVGTQQQLRDYFGGVATSLSNMPTGTGGQDMTGTTSAGLSPLAIAALGIGAAAVLGVFLTGGRRR